MRIRKLILDISHHLENYKVDCYKYEYREIKLVLATAKLILLCENKKDNHEDKKRLLKIIYKNNQPLNYENIKEGFKFLLIKHYPNYLKILDK